MSRPFPFAFKHTAKSAAPEDDAVFPQGIEVLSDPQHAIVDIVFVHGLTGDRRRTWTHPDTLMFWPKDLLSTHVPKARILTFGYDAYIIRRQGQVSTNRLADHSLDLLNALASSRQDKIMVCQSSSLLTALGDWFAKTHFGLQETAENET
jgi:hypothetical protein